MREQTCCITGQHLRPGEDREQLTQRLRNIIGQLTARDVTHFVMGERRALSCWRASCFWSCGRRTPASR